jgi:hypothetical protein
VISDADIIVNRCGQPGCGKVTAFVVRRHAALWISEFAGNVPCEKIRDHNMSAWTRVNIIRDVLILQALWTVGRSITPGLPSDPTAHILADSLGWRIGDPADLLSLPAWLTDAQGLTWPAVILAARVAQTMRDQWAMDHPEHRKWSKIVTYLRTWSDKVH